MGIGTSNQNVNVKFYRNEFAPESIGLKCSEICEFWYGDYNKLGRNEFYIHWLFPNKDCGKNKHASPITDDEIQVFKNDEVMLNRLLTSFDMMLDFFGMARHGIKFQLGPNSTERLAYLKTYKQNYMKITRILKCLHLFDMVDLWENWLHFLLELIDMDTCPMPLRVTTNSGCTHKEHSG